jgi:hypothetical protein
LNAAFIDETPSHQIIRAHPVLSLLNTLTLDVTLCERKERGGDGEAIAMTIMKKEKWM